MLLKNHSFFNNYLMKGEFEEHNGTIMLWPSRGDIWRRGAVPIRKIIVELAIIISKYEKVFMGVSSEQFMNARKLLPDDIRLFELSYDDIWIRDTSPSFITNKDKMIAIDWTFNAWGGINDGSYFPWMLDDLVPSKISEWFKVDRYRTELVLEGGSIHVDGEGTLIAIKDCISNKNRNPNLSIEHIENELKKCLGVKKIIWLEKGLYLEENNGHIDNMCAFIKPGEVVLNWTEDKTDPQYEISNHAFSTLSDAVDAKGRKLKVHKVLMPQPLMMTEKESDELDYSRYSLQRLAGDRLPASYINFYFINNAVIIPKFGSKYDHEAYKLFAMLLPEREVVQIEAREILLGGGGIHCIVQQIPKTDIYTQGDNCEII